MRDLSSRPDGERPRRLLWIATLVALLGAVLVIVVMIASGGGHSPRRHLPGGGEHTPLPGVHVPPEGVHT